MRRWVLLLAFRHGKHYAKCSEIRARHGQLTGATATCEGTRHWIFDHVD